MAKISIIVDDATAEWLERHARERNLTVSKAARNILRSMRPFLECQCSIEDPSENPDRCRVHYRETPYVR